MSKKIGVIVGSLRKGSFNRKIAENTIALAPPSLKFEFINIGNLPFYNEDLEGEDKTPAEWTEFRTQVKSCDGLLFFTPEYNRSVPAVLKNAIDVGSRPYSQSAWAKKPAGVVSGSVGAIGGFGANHNLRQSLVCLGMPCMAHPETYIGQASTLFDQDGKVTNPATVKHLQNYINAFATWIEKHT